MLLLLLLSHCVYIQHPTPGPNLRRFSGQTSPPTPCFRFGRDGNVDRRRFAPQRGVVEVNRLDCAFVTVDLYLGPLLPARAYR
jgi:hypothetical protein